MTPTELGLPQKFSKWRTNQEKAWESMLCPSPRFLLQVCPTGFGKSITYMAAAVTVGRTAILTSTKGLQTQLMRDFGEVEGITDIRGRGNYPCRLNTKLTCDVGLCTFGFKCDMRDGGGCAYYDAWRKALRSKIVITNYSYWLAQHEFSEGLGMFDLLVLDEAHAAPNHLMDHVSVSFSKSNRVELNLLDLGGSLPNTIGDWQYWGQSKLEEVAVERELAFDNRKEKQFVALKRLEMKLTRLTVRLGSSWVWEDNPYTVTLAPTNPEAHGDLLWQDSGRVVLTSATIVPKTASMLGVAKRDLEYESYPSSFPLEHRRVTHLPTVRMNYKAGEMEFRQLMSKVDNIIRPRLGTKGIIHTVSYGRRDMVIERSKYSDYMGTHQRRDTEEVVNRFKKSDPPFILVSPTMATGWDFPGDECRWQIIVKLPYPDTRGAIIKARSKMDKDLTAYMVMQQLIQAAGRGVRSADDWCETFILDNNIGWFLQRNQHLLVEWFAGAYQVRTTIPPIKEVLNG